MMWIRRRRMLAVFLVMAVAIVLAVLVWQKASHKIKQYLSKTETLSGCYLACAHHISNGTVTEPTLQHRSFTNDVTVTSRRSNDSSKRSEGNTDVREELRPLWRDVMWQEAWPEVEINYTLPGEVVPELHYLWCGVRRFRWQHYLGLLSAIRMLRPLKIFFHYTDLPRTEEKEYHTWIQELQQSMHNLEFIPLKTSHSCGSRDMLKTALTFLGPRGGFYLGQNVILTRVPAAVLELQFWFAFASAEDATRGVLYYKGSLNDSQSENVLIAVLSHGGACGTVKDYNEQSQGSYPPCVHLDDDIYPRDVWTDQSPFATLARWLYYGSRREKCVQRDVTKTIPRITHYIRLDSDRKAYKADLPFYQYLSVLSSLHVAGFQHVYLHAETEPSGIWWADLLNENVTFLPLARSRSVFNQSLTFIQHASDIARYGLLYEYGGAYQDLDVIWTSPVPDWLLQHPVVFAPDWPRTGHWPATLNGGVMLARRQAPWLRHLLLTYRQYQGRSWGFNSILMPYRVYEWFPDGLYIDPYLQVICFNGLWHPTWHSDYLRDIEDTRRTEPFDWRQTRAVHMVRPKPAASLSSPEALRKGTDLMAEVGRHVIRRSGRQHVLD